MIVIDSLFTTPPVAGVIRTQKLVVAVNADVVKLGPVAPGTGLEVLPVGPSYHW